MSYLLIQRQVVYNLIMLTSRRILTLLLSLQVRACHQSEEHIVPEETRPNISSKLYPQQQARSRLDDITIHSMCF